MMRINRMCRNGSGTDFVLIAIFIVLAFVFIQRRGYMSKVDTVIENKIQRRDTNIHSEKPDGVSVKHLENNFRNEPNKSPDRTLIDERIQKIPDVRSPECKDVVYNPTQKVTIIVDFFDYQFYDLKTTLGSILQFTPLDLIQEILVLDVGSTLEYIKQDSRVLVEKIAKAQLIRLDHRVNIGAARMAGVKVAMGDVLVFLDNNVICNKGWLEPLLQQLEKDPKSIALPHLDNINDPVSYEYQSTDTNLVTGFSWSLTLRMSKVPAQDQITSALETPVMRGNAYAVKKKFFNDIGGFDEYIEDSSGHSVEVSFRSWMCGGSLKVLPCSRVGVLNLNDPVKIVNAETIRRISEVWLGDKKDLAYRNTGTQSDTSPMEARSIAERVNFVTKQLECKSFDWYLKTAAKDIFTPSKDSKFYGLLKCKTGRCARIGDDTRVDLGKCKPEFYGLHTMDMLFEYDTNGLLKTQGKCLETQHTAYIKLVECDANENKQIWEILSGGKLKNKWSSYCAMHVTDPDKKVPKGRQIMMAQDCGLDTTGEFVGWDFLMP